MAATHAACLAYGATNQQRPHLTLPHDQRGGSESVRDPRSAKRAPGPAGRAQMDALRAEALPWTASVADSEASRQATPVRRPRRLPNGRRGRAGYVRAVVAAWSGLATYPLP